MAQASLDYERSGGELTHIRISGKVDEEFNGPRAAHRIKSKRAVVNCAGIELITSFGIRRWLEFVQELERHRTSVFFVECSPKFVEELNQVVSFTGQGRVLSAYAPYTCPECNANRSILLRVDSDAQIIRTRQPPSYSCLACGGAMEFDDDPVAYFAGLQPHVDGPVDDVVLAFLEARLGYHADTERQLHVKKLVLEDTTVLWFGGTLDGTLKSNKLAEGLEGSVVLNLSDIMHVQQAGIRAWREFVGEASRRARQITLVNCPALVIERALEGTDGVAKVEVNSVRIPYYCSNCDATEFVLLDLGSREGAEIRGGRLPLRRCAGCKSEARALVGSRLLDQLMKLPAPESGRSLSRILQRASKQIAAARASATKRPDRRRTMFAAAGAGVAVLAASLAVIAAYVVRPDATAVASPNGPERARFERPDWIVSDLAGSSYCTEIGRTLSCVGVSLMDPVRDHSEAEAFEAALEAALHQVLLNVDDAGAAAQRDLYMSTRTEALSALESARFGDKADDSGPVAAVKQARTRVATASRAQQAPGAPAQRSAWYWEEYEKTDKSGTEFMVFVRIDLSSAEREALIRHYTTGVKIHGASVLPAYPGAAWTIDVAGKTALLVQDIGSGSLKDRGVKPGDVILLDGEVAPEERAARLARAILVRRGKALEKVVELAANEHAN